MPQPGQPHVFPAKIHKIWIMRCVDVPRDVSRAIRISAEGDPLHVPVHGWIEGLPFKSTLVPRGGGSYRLHVHSRIWRKLRIDAGAAVEVTLLVDTEPREAVLPPDLAAGLADTSRALAIFNGLTVALRRQIVQYVNQAKQARTREKRILLIIKRMLERAAKRRKKRAGKKPGGKQPGRKKT
ncbi:MAG: YdeI/OmpD-associated family protein [Candidatus Acidiferrum sp.]|jgi:bacteriocin resistance YdeI/OmpD-like protein/uncharacterized protein DUF1905